MIDFDTQNIDLVRVIPYNICIVAEKILADTGATPCTIKRNPLRLTLDETTAIRTTS